MGVPVADVLLVHGQALDRRTWAAVCAQLRCEAVAIDLPGHGESPAPFPTSMADFEQAVLDGRGDARVAVGHSLGALAVLGAVCREPTAFDAVILVGLPGEPTPSAAAAQQGFAAVIEAASGYPPALLSAIAAQWLPLDDPNGADRVAAWIDAEPERVRRICSIVAAREALRPRIPTQPPRATLITGRADVATPMTDCQDLAHALGARVVEVDGAHLTPVDHPGVVAEWIDRVVGEVAG
jgi:pimeloyl-ACP methyl ester carboxylesterase